MPTPLHIPGHLAIWAGLYVTQCVTLTALLLDVPLPLIAWTGSLALAISVYLMDRAKPLDRWLDPADAEAHPMRRAFIDRHRVAVRVGAVVLAVVAAVLLIGIDPWLAALVPLSHAGVLVYGTSPRWIRPKDLLIIKNASVAISITLFAWVVVLATRSEMPSLWSSAVAGVFVFTHVFVDAMLCDIDDSISDAHHGTRTIPNTLGRTWTWFIAVTLCLAVFSFLLGAATVGLIDFRRAAVIGLCLTAGTVLLRFWDPKQVRDATDMKLPMAVAFAWLLIGGQSPFTPP